MVMHREAAVRASLDRGKLDASDASLGALRRMLVEIEPAVTRSGSDKESKRLLVSVRSHLDAAAVAQANVNPEETWREYGEALAGLVALMGHVASTSGLVVDSDPPTYFLARMVVERAPILVSRLSEARSLVPVVVKRGIASSDDVTRLRAIAILAQADLQAIENYGRELARVDPDLGARAGKPLPEVLAAGGAFMNTIETVALVAAADAKGLGGMVAEDQSIERILAADSRLHLELTQVLDARVDGLTSRRNLLIAVNVIVIGLSALLGFMLMRSVRASITNALDVAHRVASGVLTRVGEVKGADETARLMQSLGHMTQGLARMVGEVRAASDTIGADVRSLAGGNRDLAERTESQASAIEEAAASMEQLTSSVRQNRDTAKATQRIAGLAGDATSRGIEAATRVVDNMESIRKSTTRVGEIVGMIDSIAFQTNILALNAAVEAARAGEHGRGFAVVATEVRNLARRCADSAREIKGLVRGASDQVTDGARLVDEVAEAIGTINTRVAEVGELMNHIVTASAEQASGIDQVGQSITQMEHATQQNASLVEEIVAATESLSEQTARLGSLVGAFRLEGGTGSRAARLGAAEPALALPER
jgi:methyl-accepting chemotaxis protein